MEQQAKALAEFLVNRLQTIPTSTRLIVGLSGIPASGKSSLAQIIVRNVNDILAGETMETIRSTTSAILVGLDGWHLTRAQLDSFEDVKLAYDRRRGAHWTFDVNSYINFVRLLSQDLDPNSPVLTAPSFNHALKDPTPEAIRIHPEHRIVLIEGLYTILSIEPWREAAELLHERWLLKVDTDKAKERLIKRHVISGVANDWDEATWRAENNDMPNGHFILDNVLNPTRVIESVDDPALTLT